MAEAHDHDTGSGENVQTLSPGSGGEPEVVRKVGSLDAPVRCSRAFQAWGRRRQRFGGVEPESQSVARVGGAPTAALLNESPRNQLPSLPASPMEQQESEPTPPAASERGSARQPRLSGVVPGPV